MTKKTITLKSTDTLKDKKKIWDLYKENKITLSYYNNVNNVSSWIYVFKLN